MIFSRCFRIAPVAALAFTMACGGADTEPADDTPDVRSVVTVGGDFRVDYLPDPDPIPLNEPFSLTVTLARPDGLPPDGDPEVRVDASMPAHGHGMNTVPAVAPLDDGRFAIEGMLFHMPGNWEMYVDVVTGNTVKRAVFPVSMEL